MSQSDDFVQFLKKHAVFNEKTATGIDYLIMPKDFHPMASKIKYFATADPDTSTVAISEEVPPEFRDLWVEHELPCVSSEYKDCTDLTRKEIKAAVDLFDLKTFRKFIECRIALYRTAINCQPDHPHSESMKTTLKLLMGYSS
jgi:hypothetical protein